MHLSFARCLPVDSTARVVGWVVFCHVTGHHGRHQVFGHATADEQHHAALLHGTTCHVSEGDRGDLGSTDSFRCPSRNQTRHMDGQSDNVPHKFSYFNSLKGRLDVLKSKLIKTDISIQGTYWTFQPQISSSAG